MADDTLTALELLEDIDRRQNEVLSQLDELNAQVESLIARNLPPRSTVTAAAA